MSALKCSYSENLVLLQKQPACTMMFLKINSVPTNVSSIYSGKKVIYFLILAENCSYISGREIQFGLRNHQNTNISKTTEMVI